MIGEKEYKHEIKKKKKWIIQWSKKIRNCYREMAGEDIGGEWKMKQRISRFSAVRRGNNVP